VNTDKRIRKVVVAGILGAISAVLGATVGFTPVPTPAGAVTFMHIPAILGGIMEGPVVGAFVGLIFGIFSLISPAVPVKDPLVVVVPRLFIGITAWWTFALLRRAKKGVLTAVLAILFLLLLAASYEISKKTLWLGIVVALAAAAIVVGLYLWMRREEVLVFSLAVAGVVGSLTNTVLVLSAAIWRVPELITPAAALTIGLTQGIPEAIVSAIVVVAVVSALRQINTRRRGSRL